MAYSNTMQHSTVVFMSLNTLCLLPQNVKAYSDAIFMSGMIATAVQCW